MKRIVRFESCLIRTVYSKTLDKFIRTYLVNEDDAAEILASVNLKGLSQKEYRNRILQLYLHEPSTLLMRSVNAEGKEEVTDELFSLILSGNPYLAAESVDQIEVPVATAAKRKKKADDPVKEAIKLYNHIALILRENIVGQREAVDAVVKHVGRGLLRATSEQRPIAAMVFAGYSGVGKTEVARQLAKGFGSLEENLIRIDCGEYGEAFQLSRLLGAAPGYVGYDDGGLLEQKLDPEKYQVLLFDEFEKAHPKLHQLLLAALEEGVVTVSQQQCTLSLRNTVIILTSNLGTRELSSFSSPGFVVGETPVRSSYNARKAVTDYLSIELTNRLNDIIIFSALTPQEQKAILQLELAKLQERTSHLIDLSYDAVCVERCAEAFVKFPSNNPVNKLQQNGRAIRNYVQYLEEELMTQLLTGDIKQGDHVSLYALYDMMALRGSRPLTGAF